jgi:type VI protein secretion system component VasK
VPLSRLLRMVLAFAIGLLFLLVLIVLLYLTQSAFEVWTHLKETPGWFLAGFGGGILALTGSVGWVMWRLLMPERSKASAAEEEKVPPAPSEEELQQRIDKAAAAGVDVQRVRAELRRLQQRREAGFIHVSLFGEISSGKSSLITALLPDAEVEVGARGGTTRRTIE